MCTSSPSAESVPKFLNEILLIFDLPQRFRSEQGSAFTSDLITQWCSQNNVRQIFSPLGYHRGTGQFERLIRPHRCLQTLPTHCFLPTLVHEILQDLRLSAHATTDKSPFELFLARKPNTLFSNLAVSALLQSWTRGSSGTPGPHRPATSPLIRRPQIPGTKIGPHTAFQPPILPQSLLSLLHLTTTTTWSH